MRLPVADSFPFLFLIFIVILISHHLDQGGKINQTMKSKNKVMIKTETTLPATSGHTPCLPVR